MPAHRKSTVIGRGPGLDRAGRPLAERERIEHWARKAENAGLFIDDGDDWFRWGIGRLYDLAKPPVTRDDIDEMASLEEVLREQLTDYGVPMADDKGNGYVPRQSEFCDLVWRIRHVRGEA